MARVVSSLSLGSVLLLGWGVGPQSCHTSHDSPFLDSILRGLESSGVILNPLGVCFGLAFSILKS